MNKGIGIIADNSFGQRSVMDQKMMQEYSPCLREIKERYTTNLYFNQNDNDKNCDCNQYKDSSGNISYMKCNSCIYGDPQTEPCCHCCNGISIDIPSLQ